MNEETPSTPEKPPLRENRDGWPWGQLFILSCCLYLCSIGLAVALAAAGSGAHELIRLLGIGLFVSVLILALLAGHHSARLREQGERLRRSSHLRLVNIGLFGLGILLFMLAIIVPAVNKARQSARRFEQQQTAGDQTDEPWQTIRSANGLFEIDVPAHWKEAADIDVGDNGVLRSDIPHDLYAAMWSEPKADVALSNVDAYAATMIELLNTEVGQFEGTERTRFTGSGRPAIELVGNMVVQNTRLVALVRFVEMDEHFVQVRVWAVASRYDQNEATLRKILHSVRQK